jgi:zinc and cadmium transporter
MQTPYPAEDEKWVCGEARSSKSDGLHLMGWPAAGWLRRRLGRSHLVTASTPKQSPALMIRCVLQLMCICMTVGVVVIAPALVAAADARTSGAASTPPLVSAGQPASAWLPLLGYSVVIFLASLVGGWLPSLLRLTHTRLQLLISLVGGFMLGVGLFHQLPHAVVILQDAGLPNALDRALQWMMGGLVTMFFLLRWFHFHHHDTFEEAPSPTDRQPSLTHDHDHDHSHDHDHGDRPQPGLAAATTAGVPLQPTPCRHSSGHHHSIAQTSWMGVALGLSMHTLTDGLALGAHVEADWRHLGPLWWPGLGTFLGIALHKPLDSMSICSLMSASGTSARLRWIINVAYALLCPLGAMLFLVGLQSLSVEQNLLVGSALAFSAGLFVCIALSDLLPEVEFHSHDRWWLSAALVVGVVLSWAIVFLEPAHTHGGSNPGAAPAESHSHGAHSHGDHSHGDQSHDGHNHSHSHAHP